jgi:hypothetical protein
MGGACSADGEGSGVYRVLMGKPEGKRPLGRHRRRWKDNIKADLHEVGCGWTFGFHKTRGISWLDANRLVYQEVLCSMEWVSKLFRHYTSTCFGHASSPSSGGNSVYMRRLVRVVRFSSLSAGVQYNTYHLLHIYIVTSWWWANSKPDTYRSTVEPWIASNLVCECFTRRTKILKEF